MTFKSISYKLIILLCFLVSIKSDHFNSTENNQDLNYDNQSNDQQKNETENVKNFLLKKLDLIQQPTLIKDTKVPGFLLDIFEETNLFKKNNRIFLIHNSNTIRNHPLIEQKRKQQKLKLNKSGFIIRFNLSLPSKEILNAGELRLYINDNNQCSSKKQRITINQIVHILSTNKKKDNHYTTIQEESNLIYRQIDTLIVNYDKPCWVQFDVLPAVESWLTKNSTSNYGLLIKSFCVDKDEFNLNENKFVDNFILQPVSDLMDNFDETIWENFKPALLTYSNHKNIEYDEMDNLNFINKTKREVGQKDGVDSLENDWKNSENKGCTRYSMYVDFKMLGWEDWIVAPRGYDAYLCFGECSLDVVRNLNSTNQAETQSFVNKLEPNLVPPPCCVPTEFMPIALIYKEGDGTSVLKLYENMIVTKCGCK